MASKLMQASYKFTGKERDTETGLDYFGARYYGSNMGRFSSPDPGPYILRDPQTWNRYTYTRNNPLTFMDPNGMYFVVPANQGTFKSWVAIMLKSPQGAALVRRLAGDSRPITLKLGWWPTCSAIFALHVGQFPPPN